MNILNNREIAIALWLLAISIYLLLSPKMVEVRDSFKSLISAFFVKQIQVVLWLMFAYMSAVIYYLSEVDLWNIEQLKNTIFWSVSVGLISLFKLQSIKKDKSFFKHSVIDNLKLLTILQFIIGVYTFSLWIEVILAPLLAIVVMMLAIAETDKRHHKVKVLLEYCLSLFGFILIAYTFYMLVTNFGEFSKEKTAYDFFVPPLLTLLYLPFVFFMLLYSTYEQVFVRLKFSIKNKYYRYLAKLYAVILFNVRMSLLDRWSYQVAKENVESHADLIATFKYICKVRSAERKPKEISIDLGWSPYKAKDFLVQEGFDTGFYNRSYDEEWFASSRMVEFGGGLLADNIAYYVEGTEDIVNTLKIKVNVNDASRSEEAQNKLIELGNALCIQSLGVRLPEQMGNAIVNGKEHSEWWENKKITLFIEKWAGHRFNGYDLKLVISSI
ncbi:hypothetical protein CWB76_09405 [Pseudoalteromonas sp. S1609]|uniref:hypothetical protein n=1 Tax=Pseudoalteromonas sp. S1609 TaxID=579505 RepID=UPI00110A7A3E|nr:hypothetical protein [Pseudoalteromonas sp. S1609]TMP70772.1 hypothetical protein CWB76_09405 [Pseudoalteromonas sp. S1609]